MEKVKVWDRFIRFYHWFQVALLVALWWTAEEGEIEWHFLLAYVLLCLWITRIIWGCFGSDTAKFNEFIHHPIEVLSHARDIHRGEHSHYAGHTPLGGYMVALMLFLLGVQLITGLFSCDDVMTEGPLYSYVSEEVADFMLQTHIKNFDVLVVLAVLHIIVIFAYLSKQHNLIIPMLWGSKKLPKGTEVNLKGCWVAFVIFFILTSIVLFIFTPDLMM
ncbi:cytochrome b/b6 domain-containing protein [Vibrio sp. Of7-15]|uniref:cytochrome b/b6 domain-containing protein n=1 Tax=Vibrio sp. Of7-15 TaxID=2724879 RepID=UPI001EF34B79|nr:cytochrome b/b6 domain-containing protein [Vibrio sp. Of7-15]MCG7499404.1 cytochrome b/b6 domain-containing protein [Vibrio sp. Of7-15]